MEVSEIKKILKDTRGITLIWTLCLMVTIFIVGTSIMTAAGMATGVANQHRSSKACYYYTKAIAKVIAKDIETFSLDAGDPWLQIAQGVYDAKITDDKRTIVIGDTALDINLSEASGILSGDRQTEITVTLNGQRMIKRQAYSPAKPGVGEPGDEDYEAPEAEKLEITQIKYDMIIKLHTKINSQEYVVYLKSSFSGETTGVPGAGAGSGVVSGGAYSEVLSFDSI